MDIYRSEQENELTTFLLSNAGKPGGRRGIYSTLPLYTISEELLDRILTRNSVEAKQKERIKKHAVAQRQRVLSILSSETLEDEITTFLSNDFKERPPFWSFHRCSMKRTFRTAKKNMQSI